MAAAIHVFHVKTPAKLTPSLAKWRSLHRFVRACFCASRQPCATLLEATHRKLKFQCLFICLSNLRTHASSAPDFELVATFYLSLDVMFDTRMSLRILQRDDSCPNGGVFYSCNKGFVGCCLVEACNPGVGCPEGKDVTPESCK